MTNVVDILHHCGLFAGVPPAEFAHLAAIARIVNFRPGQKIFHEQDPCPGAYVVGEGMVRVYKTAPNGKEHVLHVVEPGGTFAEVAAIGGFPVPASAEAITRSRCVLLPTGPLQQLLQQNHAVCLGLMTGMALWVRQLVSLLDSVVLRDAAGRVAKYLLDLPPVEENVVELPALKRHLASHLNLTSETFSRVLRKLADSGLVIEQSGNRLRLVNPEQLRLLAQGLFPEM